MQCNLRFAEGWGAGWWAVHLDESQLGGGGGESGEGAKVGGWKTTANFMLCSPSFVRIALISCSNLLLPRLLFPPFPQ